ncbi:MAG TPA: outer membrane beta-barrel protein [Bacteroidia bacterium]|nr:outer membrane beta-barrel protein [Bacteroidia bacterium]
MNNEENNFEEFLRSKLENHTVEVSDSVWSNIEKKQKKRTRFIWFKHYLNLFVAMDILLFMAFAGLTLINNNEVKSENKLFTKNSHFDLKKAQNKHEDNTLMSQIEKENILSTTLVEEKENHIKNRIETENTKINQNNSSSDFNLSTKLNDLEAKIKNTKSEHNSNDIKRSVSETLIKESILHSELKQNEETNKIYDLAYLQTISMHNSFVSNDGSAEINARAADVGFLPPSIVLSKSKKLIKQEQKVKEKEAHKDAIANRNTENEVSNTTNVNSTPNLVSNSPSPATLFNNEQSELAISLDTVYGHKKFKGYIAIDALIAPEIAGRTLKGENQGVENYILRRDSAEKITMAYSATIRINLFLNKNIYLSTGFNFAQRKERFSILHKWQTHEPYIDSSEFVTYVDPFEGNIIYKTYDTLDYVRTHRDTLKHNLLMSFIDIPVMVGYKWLGRHSGLAIQGGLMFNMLFKQQGTNANFNYTANDVKNNNENPFNAKAGISLCGGISTNFRLRDNLDLLIEPQTRYILKPIHNEAYPLNQKLFSYGLNIGLRLKL